MKRKKITLNRFKKQANKNRLKQFADFREAPALTINQFREALSQKGKKNETQKTLI